MSVIEVFGLKGVDKKKFFNNSFLNYPGVNYPSFTAFVWQMLDKLL